MSQSNRLAWSDFSKKKGDSWLQSVRMARKAGAIQTAYRALLHADKYNPSLLHVERAKLCMCLFLSPCKALCVYT